MVICGSITFRPLWRTCAQVSSPSGLFQMCHRPCCLKTSYTLAHVTHRYVTAALPVFGQQCPYPSHIYDRGHSLLSIPTLDTSMSDYLCSGMLWDTSLCVFSQVLTHVHQPLNLTNSLEPNCPPSPFSRHYGLYSLLLGTRVGVGRCIYNFQCRSLHFMREFLCSRNTAN